ncbi:MAG: hypothetical protein RLZZ505_2023 [Verrucomicrobiota bacterium]
MNTVIRFFFSAAVFTLLAGTISAATNFVPPTEAVPPFRRDKLPIDTDAMLSLSQTMTLLSRSAAMDEAPQRRAAAQALALALALDPANASARDILSSMIEEKHLRDPDPERLDQAKDKVWKLNDWLSTPEAGNDGNLLADLLGDTAAALDPEHPSASGWLDSGERGKWDGWVAPVTSFKEHVDITPPVMAGNEPEAESDPEFPNESPDETENPGLKLSSASIKTVLYEFRPVTNSYVLGPVTVSMQASPHPDELEGVPGGEGLQINVTCQETMRWEVSQKVSDPIIQALANLHHVKKGKLTEGIVNISTGKGETYSFRRNSSDLTGPGFILANSALTGVAPDAFFVGKLDPKGEGLEIPEFFWKKLATLDDGPGGRLVVPAAAEKYLTALLAMEKPDFFLKYEVLIASSPADAIRLCAMEPDPELASTLAKFQEIKDKSSTAALGSYLANTHVRKRLVEISQAAPYHLSAKLLAIQGAGARPRALEKKILAAEIFAAVDPLDAFSEMELWQLDAAKISAMDKTQEETRERLGRILRYAEMRDRELVKSAEDVLADLRTMIRFMRDRRELFEKTEDITRAHRTFREANQTLRRELALLTGDPLPKHQ